MAENNMPATEAVGADERSHYEFAFHILPTVAEEEVPSAFGDIKTLIDTAGGHITHEEAPQRFDLAYTVVKHTEGKNYPYNHSYFGWVRFLLEPEKLEHLKTEVDHEGRVLRYMFLKLTKADAEQPFRMFEQRRKDKKHPDKADDVVAVAPKEVSEEELQRSIEEITTK